MLVYNHKQKHLENLWDYVKATQVYISHRERKSANYHRKR